MFLRFFHVAKLIVGDGDRAVRIGEIWIEAQSTFEYVDRELGAALPQVPDAEIEIRDRNFLVALRRYRRGRRGHAALADQAIQRKCSEFLHSRTGLNVFSPSRTRVRSLTWPASCPQAAAMSSPRVRRIVATIPADLSLAQKRSTAPALEH